MIEKMNLLSIDSIEAFPKDFKRLENLTGHISLRKQLTKVLVKWVLQAELTDYLGHSKNQLLALEVSNRSDGLGRKTLKGDFGALPIQFPATKLVRLSPNSSQNTRPAAAALMARYCCCMPGGHDGTRVSSATIGNAWRRGLTHFDFIGA